MIARDAAQPAAPSAAPQPIASLGHSLIFLAIVATVTLAGFAAQHRPTAGGGLASEHSGVIQLYLAAIVSNGLLAYFAWVGVRKRGGNLFDLVGGRWESWRGFWRDMGRDLLLAAPFWVVWRAAGWGLAALLGESDAKSVDILLPRSALEVAVWIATSIVAGFCEELVFRGYVQRQILGLSRSTFVAVLGQGVLFGLMHAYQGWKAMVVIIGLGILFGWMAAWRRQLRVGMLTHAWADIWAGWLQHVVGARF